MLIPSTGIAFQQDLQNAFRCTHINQLLQKFKLCHFDLDFIDGGGPHQCSVFCTEQTVSDFFPTYTVAALRPIHMEGLSL